MLNSSALTSIDKKTGAMAPPRPLKNAVGPLNFGFITHFFIYIIILACQGTTNNNLKDNFFRQPTHVMFEGRDEGLT